MSTARPKTLVRKAKNLAGGGERCTGREEGGEREEREEAEGERRKGFV